MTRITRLAMSLLQAAVTLQRPGVGLDTGGIDFPPVDDDDGDGGDEGWDWEDLQARYRARMREWARVSPFIQKVINIVYEHTFSQEPEIKVYTWSKKRSQRIGQLKMYFTWEYTGNVYEDFNDKIKAILVRSDLYRVFGVDQNELWSVLDRGSVLIWVLFQIFQEVERYRFESTGRGGSKSSATKHVAFEIYSYFKKNEERLREQIESYLEKLHPGIPCRIVRWSFHEPSGHVTEGRFFIATGSLIWDYDFV
jgi:hypothetical protein